VIGIDLLGSGLPLFSFCSLNGHHSDPIRGFFCPSLAQGIPCRSNERCGKTPLSSTFVFLSSPLSCQLQAIKKIFDKNTRFFGFCFATLMCHPSENILRAHKLTNPGNICAFMPIFLRFVQRSQHSKKLKILVAGKIYQKFQKLSFLK